MLRDLRHTVRGLWKQPAFTWIIVLTLALGIGATSAVFSLIQGVLLTPPPYRHPEQLVLIHAARTDGQKLASFRAWPAQQWTEWQQQAKSFDGIAAYAWLFNYVVSTDGSESIEGMLVTRDYFRLTGIQPVLGRTFLESETKSGGTPVVVLGYEFWQRKFNGDRNVIGKTLRISRWDTPPTVVGVMPPGIRFLPSPANAKEPNYNVNALVDFWIPVTPNPEQRKNPTWDVVGRLRGGATPRQAQEELAVIAARQAQAEPAFEGITPQIEPLGSELNRDGRRILYPLLGAAALVLLIACGNAAALLLVRGLQRQQEYAVRSALGVSRMALFRQVSSESVLLALTGGTLGVALAVGLVRIFKLIAGHAIPRLDAVTTGWPVLACGLGAAMLAAVLAGLFPALRASRLDPIEVLKSAGPKSSAGRGERRLLRGVTVVQTALTLALLVGATLLIRTMMNLSTVQAGYKTERILTMSVTAVQGNWVDFHRRALDRVSALGGVQYAAFAWGVPLTGNNWPVTVEIEGQPPALKESDKTSVPARAVTPDYFKVLGQPMAAGREIRTTDSGGGPQVAVVNQAFADRYYPGASAIGKKIWMNGRQKPATEIVGVVTNGRTDDLTQAASPEIYFSLWQARAFSKHLVVRTTADPRSLAAAVQRELRSVDPTAAVEGVKTLEQIRGESLASRTFAMQLLVGFSLIGSVLTLVGIYGVLSLSVAARRREIAIRAAVGAGRRDIRNLIFAEGFRLIAGGVMIGLGVALTLSRMLRSFLFEVRPTDPATLAGVALLFAGVAMLACWVPTHRAAKVDPVEALRYE
ncbi:MAG: ABC transporter permease [Candidatus Sulfopaludibacter sp.]|nr:ABC transporter permease [Candidatus Sulfopaludibacter sp.]